MSKEQSIQEEAGDYIFNLFKEKLPHEFVYHNYQHTLETVEACKTLAEDYSFSEKELEILVLAAMFHDTGYTVVYKGHEEESKKIAREFLEQKSYDEIDLVKVLQCIDATKRDVVPRNLEEEILRDADIVKIGQPTFFIKSDLLRAEWKNCNIRFCNNVEWEETQLHFLQNSGFQTLSAQKRYGKQHIANIQAQQKRLKKIKKKKAKKNNALKKSKAQPKRGIETMFRSLYRNHINLSSIADSKANMMINIHSLIISITLTIVGAKFSIFGTSFKQNQIIIYPIIALLMTSLSSIIFAILSAKPKVTKKITSLEELKTNDASILFFGNYTRVSIEDFEKEIKILMMNEEELYGNMVKDLYYLGRVLNKKYRLLKISYLVFMFGLIITVFTAICVVVYLKEVDETWPSKKNGITELIFQACSQWC